MMISLNKDNTYTKNSRYKGKNEKVISSTGKFEWNKTGGIIELKNENKPNTYLVGENRLFKLDINGERITGDIADRYILEKTDQQITNKYWKLVEMRVRKISTAEGE